MKTISLALVLLTATVVTAQDENSQHDLVSVVAEREGIDIRALRAVVDPPEGAETPEKALENFSRAAVDGDVDAALQLIDPEIRPLIAMEVSIDHVVMNLKLLGILQEKNGEESKSVFQVFYSCPLFTEREILMHKEFRVLEKRTIDADRVVFRVCRTGGKFSGEGDCQVVDEVLAVRRTDRWYLFYVIGYLNSAFESGPFGNLPTDLNSAASSDRSTVMSLHDETESSAIPEGVDYEKVFHVPIQVIHKELIVAARHPAIKECQQIQRRVDRSLRNLQCQLMRGDFDNVDQWTAAKRSIDEPLEITANALVEVIEKTNQRLFKQIPQ